MLSKYFDEETRKYYRTIINLEIEDYRTGKQEMTIGDAEFLYSEWNVVTNFKNGKLEFMEEIE